MGLPFVRFLWGWFTISFTVVALNISHCILNEKYVFDDDEIQIYSRLWRMHDWSSDLRKTEDSWINLAWNALNTRYRYAYKRSPIHANHKQEWQIVNFHKSEAIHHLHGIDCLFPLFVSWKVHFGNSVEFMVDLLTKNEVNSLKLECCNLFCRKLQFFSAIFCDPNGLKSLGFVRRYRKIHQGSFLDRTYLSVRRENSEHFDTSKHEV